MMNEPRDDAPERGQQPQPDPALKPQSEDGRQESVWIALVAGVLLLALWAFAQMAGFIVRAMASDHSRAVDAAAAAPWAAWFAARHLQWGPFLQDISLIVGIVVGLLAITSHVVRLIDRMRGRRR